MKNLFLFSVILVAPLVQAAVMQPKKVFVVTPEQVTQLEAQKGFGDKEPEVKMMNLMMVEGSGYEGMDMSAPQAAPVSHEQKSKQVKVDRSIGTLVLSPDPARVGKNNVMFKAAQSDRYRVEVYMTSMNMGVESPTLKESAPGVYQFQAEFSMRGPWAIKVIAPSGSAQVFDIQVQ